MALPQLPPPRTVETREHRFTIHLDREAAARLRRIAESRGEPPGRLATLLVEDGTRQLETAGVGGDPGA